MIGIGTCNMKALNIQVIFYQKPVPLLKAAAVFNNSREHSPEGLVGCLGPDIKSVRAASSKD
jgi:hypothetical protein